MSKKNKILIIFVVFLFILFFSGITYSLFSSNATIVSNNQNIAKFIFNAERVDLIDLPVLDLVPGDVEEYNFEVTNSNEINTSNVNIQYELTITTYHFIPLEIKLYSVVNEVETLLLNCDESYSRNIRNEIVCKTSIQEMSHDLEELHNYKLVVEFPLEHDDEKYSGLVDFINIEIKSWQKI